ncbi:MAG: hypothetical protein IKY61_03025 [Thermoguttaceae bacterium]|nr:hypothetical protein [Thermoguttaceae bacterium]
MKGATLLKGEIANAVKGTGKTAKTGALGKGALEIGEILRRFNVSCETIFDV